MADFSPAAAEPGIVEGDYTTWTHKWTNVLPDGLSDTYACGFQIDEKNNVVSIGYEDANFKERFGVFNLEDFSEVFLSPAGSDYMPYPTINNYEYGVKTGHAYLYAGAISTSLCSYLLFLREGRDIIDVWRGGSGSLWSHDTSAEVADTHVFSGGISLTGKWILLEMNDKQFVLYEGS